MSLLEKIRNSQCNVFEGFNLKDLLLKKNIENDFIVEIFVGDYHKLIPTHNFRDDLCIGDFYLDFNFTRNNENIYIAFENDYFNNRLEAYSGWEMKFSEANSSHDFYQSEEMLQEIMQELTGVKDNSLYNLLIDIAHEYAKRAFEILIELYKIDELDDINKKIEKIEQYEESQNL